MAPPTKFARLNQIDPVKLGEAVQVGVEEHLARVAMEIGVEWHGEVRIPQLAISVKDLTNYAIHGVGLDAPVEEYLISIAPPVWMRAADSGTYETREFDDANPDKLMPGEWLDELVLVMRAAVARERMEQGMEITPNDLAMLTSMSGDAIRNLCRSGEIKSASVEGGWKIPAGAAIEFLGER